VTRVAKSCARSEEGGFDPECVSFLVGVARKFPRFDRPSGSYTLSYDETRKQKKKKERKTTTTTQSYEQENFLWLHTLSQHADNTALT
jgi:hypothetical protein